MTSTREFWDPHYLPPGGGYEDATGAEQAPQMVPRLRQWVAAIIRAPRPRLRNTHGSPGFNHGAIAQADILASSAASSSTTARYGDR